MTFVPDQDRLKGALEQEEKGQEGNTSMQGQLGHRDQDPMLKAADTDFPEPGQNPEHTGEPEAVPEVAKPRKRAWRPQATRADRDTEVRLYLLIDLFDMIPFRLCTTRVFRWAFCYSS
jgi:hypothetical protein